MILRFCFAALLALSLPAQAELPIQAVTSPGGLTAWLVEDHEIPFTALEIRMRGGTSLDPADLGLGERYLSADDTHCGPPEPDG